MVWLDTMRLDEEFDYTYLSLGAGVQSSALLVLGCTDDRVPKPDFAIFADTGDEPQYVYDYLDILTEYAADHGIKVVKAQKGRLSDWVREHKSEGKRFASLPVFTKNDNGSYGMLRRQCTREFKVEPITQKVRELLGYKPRFRVKERVRCMIGISLDEAQRMKESRIKWIKNTFPLIDLAIKREHCFKIMEDAGLPKPKKSSCVFCPYHSDSYWQWMKDEHPEEFSKAVDFDNLIRDMTMRGVEQPAYLHNSCVPLKDVEFNAGDKNQVDMFNNECEGMCGV
jgi:hypothetical protein